MRSARCDACDAPRKRWQRLCETCFAALPRDLRYRLLDAWRCGRQREWRQARREARAHIAERAAARPDTSPEAAYARHQRLLGEKD